MKRSNYLLLFAQWISNFGNHLHQIALPLLVYQKTGSAGDFALSLFAETVPWVFIAPVLSTFLKKFSSKNVLLVSDIFRAVLTLAIAFYDWNKWEILIIVFALGSFSSIYGAFRIQTVKQLISNGSLNKYLSLSNGGNEFIALVAPLLGTILVSFGVSANYFMAIDSFTFVVSTGLLLFIPLTRSTISAKKRSKTSNPLKLLKKVEVSEIVKVIAVSEGLRSVAEGLFIPSLLTLLIKVNGFNQGQYTWIRTGMAIAGMLSAYIFLKYVSRWTYFRTHTVSTLLIAMGVILLPFISQFNSVIAVTAIVGLGMSLKQLLSDNIVITGSKEEVQAETVTIVNSLIALSYCVGYIISAKLDDEGSVLYLFASAGIILLSSLFLGKKLSVNYTDFVKEAEAQ